MIFSKETRFIYLFLALIFSVAVSGGCGGGGSGRYYGDYGQDRNSSQDVTPAPESQDVIPENTVSEDQYGNENGNEDYGVNGGEQNGNASLDAFVKLNNTEWVISSVRVSRFGTVGTVGTTNKCNVKEGSFNCSADKVRFKIDGNVFTYYDSNNNHHIDDLTVDFYDPESYTDAKAPIIKAAAGFSYSNNEFNHTYRVTFDGDYERESFSFAKKLASVNTIYVNNYFYVNDVQYVSNITLKPYVNELNQSDDVRYFGMLMDSEWAIKNVSVYLVKDSPNYPMIKCQLSANSYNYPANKLKFWTDVDNEGKYNYEDTMMWYDGNGDMHPNSVNPLTISFKDPNWNLNVQRLDNAPILRAAPDFKKGYSAGSFEHCEVSFGSKESQTLSIAKNLKEMIVENHFYIYDVHYFSCMELSRLDIKPNSLVKLNSTEWVISKLRVTCESSDESGNSLVITCSSVDQPYNYAAYNTIADKTVFFTTNENTFTWFDNQYLNRPQPLTVKVINPANEREITLPILKSVRDLNLDLWNDDYEGYNTKFTHNFEPSEVLVEGSEEIIITKGSNGAITGVCIDNDAYLGALVFKTHLELKPYEPNN